MKIAVASDHAGYPLKKSLVEVLHSKGHEVEDFGCHSEQSADVSDHVAPAAEALGQGKFDRAVFVDGAGYPSGMVANMHHGVFAAVCNDPVSAKLAREHGGANALCIGAMIIGAATAQEILRLFLESEPLGGKYEARRKKVEQIGAAKRIGPLFRTRKVITVDDLRESIMNKEALIIDEKTIITPSVIDAVRNLRA